MDAKALYKELVKSFFLAFKRLSLYAVDHPLSRDILVSLTRMFDALLKDQAEILFVAGAGANEIIVNGQAMDSDAMGVSELYDKFKLLKLDGVSFIAGLTLGELSDFVKAMATAAVRDAGKTLAVPALLRDGSLHIKIKKLRYERIEEGQRVVSQADLGGAGAGGFGSGDGGLRGGGGGDGSGDGPGGGGGRGRVLGGVKNFLIGKMVSLDVKAEEILGELEHDVSGVTQTIIESAKESGDFEGVIRKFVGWVAQHVVPTLVERKRDPSKFVLKVFDTFKKDETFSAFPDAAKTVASCADDIMVAMAEEAFSTYKTSSKKGIALAAKILSDEDDQKRVWPKLKQRLAEHGVAPEMSREFLQKVETELAKDEEVPISKKKLHKLMRISERFEEEVGDRVRAVTSDLAHTNRRLADDKERTESVMRHLADGLVVVDREGNIVMMNPAAEKLLNTELKESVGKSLADSIKDEHLLAMAKGAMDDKNEGLVTKEIEVASKEEKTKMVLKASSAVVENESGQSVGMVTVLSDITRQKELEDVKAQFVSLVTHELRTPVAAIQKALELILSEAAGAVSDDQKKFLSMSRLNIDRLNKLISDLLDISQLESGRMMLRSSTFDFRGVVLDAKSSLQSWADGKKIDIQVHMQEAPLNILADRNRLFQVMVNLLSNALKFTSLGGIVNITVNTLEKKDGICEEPCVEVMVIDNGIGIAPRDFKRIFNKFEQVSLVSPQGVAGSGLGLPISKEVICLHGGTIWVESEKGKGSRFIFVIPQTLKKR